MVSLDQSLVRGNECTSRNNLVSFAIIDLFSGVGGLSLGAARAGFRVAAAVENDPHAMAAHKVNFPETVHLKCDVNELTGLDLIQKARLKEGEEFGIVGGPPCQGFSTMGRRDKADLRNNLFGKFFSLVSEAKPLFFVAENVPGILDEAYQPTRISALAHVSDDYDLMAPFSLKANDFGAPTSRERVFFIGFRKDHETLPSEEDFDAKKVAVKTLVRDALLGLPLVRCDWQSEKQGWRTVARPILEGYASRITSAIPDGVGDLEAIERLKENVVSGCLGTRHKPEVVERFRNLKEGAKDAPSKAVRLKLDGFCPTLRAGTASDRGSYQAVRPIHPTSPRVITPREAARLQGFPDWFRFAPSKWHSFRQIGNSVSPFVSEAVLGVIYDYVTRSKR